MPATGPNFEHPESLLPYLNLRLRLSTIEQMDRLWFSLNEGQANPDALTVIIRRGYYQDMIDTNPVIRDNADRILAYLETTPQGTAEEEIRANAFKQGCGFAYASFLLQCGPNIPELTTEAAKTGRLWLRDVYQKRRESRQEIKQAMDEVMELSDSHLERDLLLRDYLEGYAVKAGRHWSQKYYFMTGGGFIGYSLAVAEAYPRMIAGELPKAPEDPHEEVSAEVDKLLKDIQDYL